MIDFVKQNWTRILLAAWCVWATVKLNRIEEDLAMERTVLGIQAEVDQLGKKLEEFRAETRRAHEQEAFSRALRR